MLAIVRAENACSSLDQFNTVALIITLTARVSLPNELSLHLQMALNGFVGAGSRSETESERNNNP